MRGAGRDAGRWLGGLRLVLLAGLASACVAPRVVAPPGPTPLPHPPPARSHVELHLEHFDVVNMSQADDWDAPDRLAVHFLEYLGSAARYGAVGRVPMAAAPGHVEVGLDAIVTVQVDDRRTFVLDVLFFYPFVGLLPIVPEWGQAVVRVDVSAAAGGGPRRPIASAEVAAPYSMVFYSWYRTAPLEAAFARAYDRAFTEVGRQVAEWTARLPDPEALALASAPPAREAVPVGTASVGALAPAPEPDTSTATLGLGAQAPSTTSTPAVALPAVPPSSSPPDAVPPPPSVVGRAPPPPAADAELAAPVRLELAETGFRLIQTPLVGADRPLWLRYLAELGGLEVAWSRGIASVRSEARTESGVVETVGSGDAVSEGFKVALFKPPDRTGFFFPPSFGFLSQTITIRGFVEDVPIFDLPGADTIPALVTDPTTGAPLDPDEPISYELRLRSLYLGQQVGLNLVGGNEDVQIFGTLRAGVNLVELRFTDVTLDTAREKETSFEVFKSILGAAQIGISVPALHAALRASAQVDYWLPFRFEQPVDFLAQPRFDPEKQIFERQRVFVEGASLLQLNYQLSAVVLF